MTYTVAADRDRRRAAGRRGMPHPAGRSRRPRVSQSWRLPWLTPAGSARSSTGSPAARHGDRQPEHRAGRGGARTGAGGRLRPSRRSPLRGRARCSSSSPRIQPRRGPCRTSARIARATVSADAIREAKTLQAFAGAARRCASRRRAASQVATIPLFTAADIAALKPYVAVRTRAEVRNRVLLFGGALCPRLSRRRLDVAAAPRRGDRLAARHRASAHRHRLRGAPEPARSVARQPAVRALRGNHHRRPRADGRPVARRFQRRRASARSAICRWSARCRCRCC